MQNAMVSGARSSSLPLEWLVPLADRVGALARSSGRAFVEGNARLAASLLAVGGEHSQIDSALDGAWSEVLGAPRRNAIGAEVGLITSLHTIADLAARICAEVIQLSDRPPVRTQPAIHRLAELVPELLGDALWALRENDGSSADRVLQQGPTVDACFAQTYLDLLDVAGRVGGFDTAQRLHAVSSAFERIGDGASDIANSVRAALS